MPLSMITGNATEDGAPIYLRADGTWTRALAEGHATSEDEAARLLTEARPQQRVVSDPYVIEVVLVDGRPAPASLRERIRAEGPTVLLERARVAARRHLEVEPELRLAANA